MPARQRLTLGPGRGGGDHDAHAAHAGYPRGRWSCRPARIIQTRGNETPATARGSEVTRPPKPSPNLRVLHAYHHPNDEAAVNGFHLDPELIDAFSEGNLDQQGEAVLARRVARVLPAQGSLPNPVAAALSRVVARLGGETALFAWLRSHPGLPRLVATVYALIGLLDRLSDLCARPTRSRGGHARCARPRGRPGRRSPESRRGDRGQSTSSGVGPSTSSSPCTTSTPGGQTRAGSGGARRVATLVLPTVCEGATHDHVLRRPAQPDRHRQPL